MVIAIIVIAFFSYSEFFSAGIAGGSEFTVSVKTYYSEIPATTPSSLATTAINSTTTQSANIAAEISINNGSTTTSSENIANHVSSSNAVVVYSTKSSVGNVSGHVSDTTKTAPTSNISAGVIVPLYTQPSDSSWSELITTKNDNPSVPIVAIINPDSGPGSGASDQWANGIDELRSAGITVIGYVPTGYGTDPLSTVESQVQDYSSWYRLSGIFFDEMANDNGTGNCPWTCTVQQYYQDLVSYSSTVGYNFTVGNPGMSTDPSFHGIMSVLLIYENSGSPSSYALKSATMGYDKSRYASISIGVGLNSTAEISSASYVGWIYMTNACTGRSVSVCNPYNGLPSYFSELVSNLAG